MLLHAGCVALNGRGILIVGPSRAGKSDLALRLIDRGAVLVADDQVELTAVDTTLIADVPATIAGKLEVRGLGIVDMPYQSPVPVSLLIDLAMPVERMPEPRARDLCGIGIPLLALNPHEASAPMKAELALATWGLPL